MPSKRTKKSLKSTKHHAALASKKAKSKETPKKAPAKAKAVKAASAKAAKAEVSKSGAYPVYDLKGKSQETLSLDPIFQGEGINTKVIYQSILMYRAGEREGTAATKTRGEVRGGGKKPWKQKGTGQARHGSRRSPIWRGGGATFGPHPRDYSYTIPAQIRKSAVVEVFRSKISDGKITFVNGLEIDTPKTKVVAGILETFKLEKPLFLVDKKSENLLRASRNVQAVNVKTAAEVNALDLASSNECLVTKSAYAGLLKRFKS
ncbi:MAG TPA: 50S ribosomal protein L4 [Candidatus Omnitrophota bacterium]|nr:50S ribosomal protein L4 [Candidatus Omnitrophota bacterium]